MNIFSANKVMTRLDNMITGAIDGNPIESHFDETKMSALETKLARYLAMTGTGKNKLIEEKEHINMLISDISHQTKTPISNILLYAQLLEESSLSPKDRDCVNALIEQTEKLNFLIGSLLNASRLEMGIITVMPTESPIKPLINSVLTQISPRAESKNISILFSEEISFSALFDPKWTGEALFNIMDNAIKYTPTGGSISIRAVAFNLFCKIDITDTGMGIKEDERSKIFSRFYRSPQVSDIEGVGIGLYLAREIISKQGGYIKVSSKEGEGSTFSLFLPINS